jgi:hypothetical protein
MKGEDFVLFWCLMFGVDPGSGPPRQARAMPSKLFSTYYDGRPSTFVDFKPGNQIAILDEQI